MAMTSISKPQAAAAGSGARSVPHSIALGVVLFLGAASAGATDVSVAGVFPGKAVLVVDGGAPRTISVGERTAGGVKLLAVDGGVATLEFDGRRHRLAVGEQAVSAASGSGVASAVTLTADGRGHFVTAGSVNGSSVSFVVDTGATLVSLGAGDAVRAGLDYRKGEPSMAMTANGATRIWRVKLATVKIGDITLHDVDGAVHGHDMPVALLGMSFLGRMEMKRDGDTMTLRRRF
jgi:aspartyl protease family protein